MSDRTPEEIRTAIAEERAALGETAAALAERADVTGRAKHAAQDTADRAKHAAQNAVVTVRDTAAGVVARARSGEDRRPLFAVGAVIGALVTVLVVRAVRR
ncbi:DUF3618 domain-containing protein [Pseudonocardia xishanensis]|uniref:DUF3618 domain-containing protein n=1 Tax=Pseudonocardia xishanensis TaxID=630995 RepID=A0ABP8S3Y6_9PSEU